MRPALAALIAVALVVTGCGEDEHPRVPARAVAGAVERTIAAPSERVHVEITVRGTGLDDTHAAGDGLIDNRRQEGRMALDVSEFADLLGASDQPGAGILQAVADAGTAYVRWPPRTGTTWVRFDLPQGRLDRLRVTGDEAEVLGNATVRGAPTTHYKTTIDVGPRSVPAEVWVEGRAGRVRRARFKAPVDIPNVPGSFEMEGTIELYDFGVRVPDVEPPR